MHAYKHICKHGGLGLTYICNIWDYIGIYSDTWSDPGLGAWM